MKCMRNITRQLVHVSPDGNTSYRFHRDVKRHSNGEPAPYVIIIIKKPRAEEKRIYIPFASMNEGMVKRIMSNFKKWCESYIVLSGEYDPETDRIIEI